MALCLSLFISSVACTSSLITGFIYFFQFFISRFHSFHSFSNMVLTSEVFCVIVLQANNLIGH